MIRELLALIAAFAVGTAVAAAAGAANLGTAMTFGTIAFAAALMWILFKRP